MRFQMHKSFVPVAILGSICLTIFMPVKSFSQVKGDQPTTRLEFEAASVKPSASARLLGTMVRDGKLTATGISLKALMALAYDVREAEISEGPNWVGSERYDINAKAAGAAAVIAATLRPLTCKKRQSGPKRSRDLQDLAAADCCAAGMLTNSNWGGKSSANLLGICKPPSICVYLAHNV
jgi:hypothetical protein